MERITAQFEIAYRAYLDSTGNPLSPFPEVATPERLVTLYRHMRLIRLFDTKAVNLQRTGKMGTYPASTGHEAISAAIGDTMQSDDILCPYYRDQGVSLLRGVSLSDILAYWGGDERGTCYTDSNDFPPCVPIATQCLHATGVAYAMQYRDQKNAVVTTIGEGGSSKGDFYEALNVAGCWNLPVVFVVINNQWAISVPRDKQTSTQTIAQKAIAGGFEGIQVDGNDVVAMLDVMTEALNKAYSGGGPTLIEAVTYRLCDHTTADDATRYHNQTEHERAWKEEPLARLHHYLLTQKCWSEKQEKDLRTSCKEKIETAVADYINQSPAPKTDIIDYMFDTLPEALQEQRDHIEGLL